MRVMQVHNRYRLRGGEDAMLESTLAALERRGIEASLFEKSSQAVGPSLVGKMHAFASGVYSRSAAREMSERLADARPDVVHVHNLYPLLSPSVLGACRRAGVPVVMTCHNYRLICPIGVLYRRGAACERCAGGREYWCVLRNCRDRLDESVAYALRNAVARVAGLYKRNVTCYVAVSEFLKRRLVEAGFPADRIDVVPNIVSVPEGSADPPRGEYVAYVGRLTAGKGVTKLLEAVRMLPDVPFRLAGEGELARRVREEAPPNLSATGLLSNTELADFYAGARFLVVPSDWYETFGLVAAEAMVRGVPVIASRSGGLPEVVEDNVTGVLFERGDAADLAAKIARLWNDPALCRRMGQAGRARVVREYNEEAYYDRLMAVYRKAITLAR